MRAPSLIVTGERTRWWDPGVLDGGWRRSHSPGGGALPGTSFSVGGGSEVRSFPGGMKEGAGGGGAETPTPCPTDAPHS